MLKSGFISISFDIAMDGGAAVAALLAARREKLSDAVLRSATKGGAALSTLSLMPLTKGEEATHQWCKTFSLMPDSAEMA